MEPQRTYLLTTAKICEVDTDLSNSKSLSRGNIPLVPELEGQKDLMKMVSILLSTGINRNDDVFVPGEILPARNTGAHKPVNLEHDPKKIIGHMIRTYATHKGGKRIADNVKPKSNSFDITAEAVIYKFLFPDLAEDIKGRADSNELFVSVEAWFTAFDFLVGNKIIKRNSQTASILEPRLRINGGAGTFEGQRVGRVLKNILIGGIGVVKDPANPESIIKSVSSSSFHVVQDVEDRIIASNIIGGLEDAQVINENNLEETMVNQEVIEEMSTLAAAIQAKASEDKVENEESVAITEALPESLSDNPFLKKIIARIETVEKQNEGISTRLVEADNKVEASRRAAVLGDIGIEDDLAEKHMVKCFNMTAEQFNDHVSDLKEILLSLTKNNTIEETPAVAEVETETEVETEVVDVDVVSDVSDVLDEEVTDEVAEDLEIEPLDPEVNIETDKSEEVSISDQMADIVQKFLQKNDKKWEKLNK